MIKYLIYHPSIDISLWKHSYVSTACFKKIPEAVRLIVEHPSEYKNADLMYLVACCTLYHHDKEAETRECLKIVLSLPIFTWQQQLTNYVGRFDLDWECMEVVMKQSVSCFSNWLAKMKYSENEEFIEWAFETLVKKNELQLGSEMTLLSLLLEFLLNRSNDCRLAANMQKIFIFLVNLDFPFELRLHFLHLFLVNR